jgi:laminin gamma 1
VIIQLLQAWISVGRTIPGQRCDRCKAGHFYIDVDNEFGCTPCFCYGHTSECGLSGGFTQADIRSDFSRSVEGWTTDDVLGALTYGHKHFLQ